MKTLKTGIVLLALLLAGIAMVPMVSATERSDQTGNHFSIEGLTTIKILNVHDKNELKTETILSPQELTIPQPVKKFDLVTFDIPAINKKSGNRPKSCRCNWGIQVFHDVNTGQF